MCHIVRCRVDTDSATTACAPALCLILATNARSVEQGYQQCDDGDQALPASNKGSCFPIAASSCRHYGSGTIAQRQLEGSSQGYRHYVALFNIFARLIGLASIGKSS